MALSTIYIKLNLYEACLNISILSTLSVIVNYRYATHCVYNYILN